MSLLVLEGVRKSVRAVDGSVLEILRGVDLRVEEGQMVSIVGRSGSGKSTLLNILGMLDVPSAGGMWFAGVSTVGLLAGRRDRLRGGSIGFVFQQFNLLPGRSAVENVAMPLLYERGVRFWRREAIARQMLERVGLGHRLEALPSSLSGGEQQRVAIARALVREPRLILADEPTGALDEETGERVMSLLEEVVTHSGAALVTITHDPDIAARANHRLRLDHGRISHDAQHRPDVPGASGTPASGTSGGVPRPSSTTPSGETIVIRVGDDASAEAADEDTGPGHRDAGEAEIETDPGSGGRARESGGLGEHVSVRHWHGAAPDASFPREESHPGDGPPGEEAMPGPADGSTGNADGTRSGGETR